MRQNATFGDEIDRVIDLVFSPLGGSVTGWRTTRRMWWRYR